jgi:nucleotide-binding universal stress UspA family protein
MYDSLLVPVGPGIETNTAALDEAARISEVTGADIHLLFVFISYEEREDNLEGEYPRAIEHALDYLDTLPTGREVTAQIHVGDPAEEIVITARDRDVDAIVMGTAADTGVKRMLLGSVTEAVIREFKKPVVAVTYHEDDLPRNVNEDGEIAAE